MQSRWFLALNRPRVVSVLLSEVHLQQAFILAATGRADKRHNGRGCGVNHPSARPQQSCAYCRIPALMSLCCPRWYLGYNWQNSILPSCSTTSQQCCRYSPHAVFGCATEVVSYMCIPVSQWLMDTWGLKQELLALAQAANSEIWVCNLGFFCAPWSRKQGHPRAGCSSLPEPLVCSRWKNGLGGPVSVPE